MWACYIDNAHHTVLVDNAHFGFHSVISASVDGNIVVRLGNTVADDMRHHKSILLQRRLMQAVGCLQGQISHLVAQLNQFHFQGGVTFLQALIDAMQVEIGRHAVERLVDRGAQ